MECLWIILDGTWYAFCVYFEIILFSASNTKLEV